MDRNGASQANYAAAKAGIAALTMVDATELARYGATANAVAPIALTRMSTGILSDTFSPDHVSELVAWLASEPAQDITGHVFSVGGGHISVADRWHTGTAIDKPGLWNVDELALPTQAIKELAERFVHCFSIEFCICPRYVTST